MLEKRGGEGEEEEGAMKRRERKGRRRERRVWTRGHDSLVSRDLGRG